MKCAVVWVRVLCWRFHFLVSRNQVLYWSVFWFWFVSSDFLSLRPGSVWTAKCGSFLELSVSVCDDSGRSSGCVAVMVIHTAQRYELDTVHLYQHQTPCFVTVRCYLMRSDPVGQTIHKDTNLQIFFSSSDSLRWDGYIKKYFQNILTVFEVFLFVQLILRYLNSYVYKCHPNTARECPGVA